MDLLEKMQFSIDTMTFGEKFLGSAVVTLLGVGIVFIALITLYITIVIMQKAVGRLGSKKEAKVEPITKEPAVEDIKDSEDAIDNTELVAVITAAVAASLHTSTHNIIVRNITRTKEVTPSWAKIGRIDQMH